MIRDLVSAIPVFVLTEQFGARDACKSRRRGQFEFQVQVIVALIGGVEGVWLH